MKAKRFVSTVATIKAVLLALLCLSLHQLVAKNWLTFKFNLEYLAAYPEDWQRNDPESRDLNLSPKDYKGKGEAPNLQIRTYELSSEEAALAYQEFIDLQLVKHARYLEDNWWDAPKIGSPDTLRVGGADDAFHLRTDLEEMGNPSLLITDYARKGNKMYIFRWFCDLSDWEKYQADYLLMRDGFQLR